MLRSQTDNVLLFDWRLLKQWLRLTCPQPFYACCEKKHWNVAEIEFLPVEGKNSFFIKPCLSCEPFWWFKYSKRPQLFCFNFFKVNLPRLCAAKHFFIGKSVVVFLHEGPELRMFSQIMGRRRGTSSGPARIQAHNLSAMRRALYCCASISVHENNIFWFFLNLKANTKLPFNHGNPNFQAVTLVVRGHSKATTGSLVPRTPTRQSNLTEDWR